MTFHWIRTANDIIYLLQIEINVKLTSLASFQIERIVYTARFSTQGTYVVRYTWYMGNAEFSTRRVAFDVMKYGYF